MWWTISGDRVGTSCTIAANGTSAISGKGHQTPPQLSQMVKGIAIDATLAKRLDPWEEQLKICTCRWQLRHSPSLLFEVEEEDSAYAEAVRSMIEKVKNAPTRPQWRVIHHSGELSFMLVVSNSVFTRARRQVDLLLASDSLRYSIVFQHYGLNINPKPGNEPTFEQFFDGAPLFSDKHAEITISARRSNDA